MTREEAVAELKEIQRRLASYERPDHLYDEENAHHDADAVLMKFLFDLGYEDVVKEFDDITKWYA